MRIGIDARSIFGTGGGIGICTYNLIINLSRVDNRNRYFLFFDSVPPEKLAVRGNFRIEVIPSPRSVIWEQLLLPFVLFRNKIDIYHAPRNGFVLPKFKRWKNVITLYDLIPLILPETCPREYLFYVKRMPQILNRTDIIIAPSKSTKGDITQEFGISEDRIRVIYPGVDKRYTPLCDKNKIRKIKERYHIKDSFILNVGGFHERKNLFSLIRAYHKFILKNKVRDCKLVIAGQERQTYRRIIKLVVSLNLEKQTIFAGFVPLDDLPLLYNAAEVFVFPSLYEGFGLPPLEAMACGTPVITSNTSSLPEVVGDAGIMVNPNSVDELTQAIHRVLTDEKLRSDMIHKGPKQAKKFSWEKTAQETLKVYEEVVGL